MFLLCDVSPFEVTRHKMCENDPKRRENDMKRCENDAKYRDASTKYAF